MLHLIIHFINFIRTRWLKPAHVPILKINLMAWRRDSFPKNTFSIVVLLSCSLKAEPSCLKAPVLLFFVSEVKRSHFPLKCWCFSSQSGRVGPVAAGLIFHSYSKLASFYLQWWVVIIPSAKKKCLPFCSDGCRCFKGGVVISDHICLIHGFNPELKTQKAQRCAQPFLGLAAAFLDVEPLWISGTQNHRWKNNDGCKHKVTVIVWEQKITAGCKS